MKMENSFKAVFASMMIVSGLAACDKPNSAESAGKKIDQTTESVSAAVSNTADKADMVITQKSKETGQVMDDTQITAKVKAALLNEPGMQSMKITVTTLKGVVSLSGSVNSQENKDKAGKLSAAVDGVTSIKNTLTVIK